MPQTIKFYAIMREYKKGKWDIIMDWETNKLCVYDSKKVAYNSLKQYKKYYPDDGSKIVVGIFKY